MTRVFIVALLLASSLRPARAEIFAAEWDTSDPQIFAHVAGKDIPFKRRWAFNADYAPTDCSTKPDENLALMPDFVEVYHATMICPEILGSQMTFHFEVNVPKSRWTILAIDINGIRQSDEVFLDYLAHPDRPKYGSYQALLKTAYSYPVSTPRNLKGSGTFENFLLGFSKMGMLCVMRVPEELPKFALDCVTYESERRNLNYDKVYFTFLAEAIGHHVLLRDVTLSDDPHHPVSDKHLDDLLRTVFR
jgi:hypothetical protein